MEVFVFDWWWTSHQSLAHKGLRILRFCIVSWKDERKLSIKYCMGRQIDVVQKFIRIQSFGKIDGEPMEFEWNVFPGFTTLHLSHKVRELLSWLSVTPEKFIGRTICMFNNISWGSTDNMKECEANAQLVSLTMQRDSEQDNGHSLGLDQRKSGTLLVQTVHKENGTKSLSWWC